MSGAKKFLQGFLLCALPLFLRNTGRTVPRRKSPRRKCFSSHKYYEYCLRWGRLGGHPLLLQGSMVSSPGNDIWISPKHALIPTVRKMLSLPSNKHKSSALSSGMWQQGGLGAIPLLCLPAHVFHTSQNKEWVFILCSGSIFRAKYLFLNGHYLPHTIFLMMSSKQFPSVKWGNTCFLVIKLVFEWETLFWFICVNKFITSF